MYTIKILIILSFILFTGPSALAESVMLHNLQTNKNSYYPGEPVLIRIEFKNTGDTTRTLDLGWDDVGAFEMEIKSEENTLEQKGPPIEPRGGLAAIGRHDIPAGKSMTKSIVLNRWCSTGNLSEGKHFLNLKLNSKTGAATIAKEFHIKSLNAQDFKKSIDDLARIAFGETSDAATKDITKDEAIEMLIFAETMQHKKRVLGRSPYPTQMEIDGVESIGRMKDIEAAQLLMEINQDQQMPLVLRNLANSNIHKLRKNGSPALMNITNDYVKTQKEPPIQPSVILD